MSFRDDYLRRLLERLDETAEERIVERRHREDQRDTLQNVDVALAEKHRFHPERLRSTLDDNLLDQSASPPEDLDDPFVIRTAVCRQLERSPLSDETILFLIRSIFVGTQRLIKRGRSPSPPAQLLADLLRQQRIAHVLERDQVTEAWRALFELEADRDNFSYAEDYLFHAVRLAPDPSDLVQQGLDFYERILALPDPDLENGGLSREEADRARWELLEMVE